MVGSSSTTRMEPRALTGSIVAPPLRRAKRRKALVTSAPREGAPGLEPVLLEQAEPDRAAGRETRHRVPEAFERHLCDHGDRGRVKEVGDLDAGERRPGDDAAILVDYQARRARSLAAVEARAGRYPALVLAHVREQHPPGYVADRVEPVARAHVLVHLDRLARLEPDGLEPDVELHAPLAQAVGHLLARERLLPRDQPVERLDHHDARAEAAPGLRHLHAHHSAT